MGVGHLYVANLNFVRFVRVVFPLPMLKAKAPVNDTRRTGVGRVVLHGLTHVAPEGPAGLSAGQRQLISRWADRDSHVIGPALR